MPASRPSSRRPPVAVAALVVACAGPLVDALLGGRLVGTPWSIVAAAASGYLVGAWLPLAWAALACLVGTAALTVANQVVEPGRYSFANDYFFFGLVVGGLALVGALVTARRAQVSELRRLAALRDEQRTTEVHAAQVEERNRLEAGVTQAVMQRIGALVVQAAGARREPDQTAVRRAISQIEDGGRLVLDELRHVVGLLRGADHDDADEIDGSPVPPARPGLGRIDVLSALSGMPLAVELAAGATSPGPAAVHVLAAIAVGLPLIARRRLPVAAAAGLSAVATSVSVLLTPLGGTAAILLPVSLAAYAIGAYARGWRRLAGVAVLVAGGAAIRATGPIRSDDSLGATTAWLAVAVLSGVAAARFEARAADLRRLIALTDAGRAGLLRLAVAEQREAVARDLHDTVAAAMTVVCLHAGAAGQRADDDTRLRESLATIETAAREAMVALRRGLEVLEDDAGDLETELVAFADLLALRPTITVERGLQAGERSLARRVVRETLVNVARHAPGSATVVRVRDEAGDLVVEVANSASERTGSTRGTGTGLIGLDELVRHDGGRLEHGRTADGGFRVAAYLPLVPEPG